MAQPLCLFNSQHPVHKKLQEAGYIPPHCRSVTIELVANQLPLIRTEAYAGPELAEWIADLRSNGLTIDEVPVCSG